MASPSQSQRSQRPPAPLKILLDLDIKLTNNIVTFAHSNYPQLRNQSWKSFMSMLEISCHGIPWLAITLLSIYMFKSSHNVAVNLLIALLLDIATVATVKSITRRPRPIPFTSTSPLNMAIGPDKLSFPSGHATRAILLTLFFTHVTSSHPITLLLSIWSCLICASRVLMRRHHLLDVTCGIVIGGIEWAVMYYIWVGDSGTSWIAGAVGGAEDEFDGA